MNNASKMGAIMNSLPNLNSAKNPVKSINQIQSTTNVDMKHRANKLSHSIAQINHPDKNLNIMMSPEDKSDKVSVPSDLSEDLWGELPRHNYRKFLE